MAYMFALIPRMLPGVAGCLYRPSDLNGLPHHTRNQQKSAATPPIPEADVDVTMVKSNLERAKPLVLQVEKAINYVGPFVEQGIAIVSEQYGKLERFHPEKLIPFLFGVFLVFFGVCVTLACMEPCVCMLVRRVCLDRQAHAGNHSIALMHTLHARIRTHTRARVLHGVSRGVVLRWSTPYIY